MVEVDRDREGVDLGIADLGEPARRPSLGGELGDCGGGVAGIVLGLEAEQIGATHATRDVAAPWQGCEQLDPWKGDVQEQTDPQVGPARPDHRRREQEVIVVNPDQPVERCDHGHRLGVALVDVLIRPPPTSCHPRLAQATVEQRPQQRVGETVVVVVDLAWAEVDHVQVGVVDRRLDVLA